MNSKEINDKICKLDDIDPPIYESCIGEKLIPYIGWCWRTVNFDAATYYLGVVPPIEDDEWEQNDRHKVGFMENNKWGYHEFKIDKVTWSNLKRLIVTAVEEETKEAFKMVDDYMQSLLPEIYKVNCNLRP